MNPLLAKLLPWALVAILAGGAVFGFAKYEQAKGAAKANLATAERFQEAYERDSIALVKVQAERQKEKQEAVKKIEVATVKQRLAARRADSLATELRVELPDTLQPKLDAVLREHEQERAQFAVQTANYQRRIALLVADSTDAQRQLASLRQINQSLKLATQGSSVTKHVLPYVIVAGAVAGTIAVLAK